MEDGARESGQDPGAVPKGAGEQAHDCACGSRGPLLLLAGGLIFLLVNNALWTVASPLPPPMHNLHEHLELLTEGIRQLGSRGWEGLWSMWTKGYYPPLLHIFGYWLNWLLDAHWYIVYIPGTLAMLGIGVGTYLAGSALFDRRTGAFAGVLAAAAPIVVGMSRTFDPPLPSTALVALAIGMAVRSEGFTRFWPTIWAFGLATVAMMTNRVIPAVHLIVPFLVVEWKGRSIKLHRAGLLIGVALACLLAGPFHLNWLAQWIGSEVGRSRTFGDANPEHFWHLRSWLYYVLALPDNQLHLPLSLALLMALPALRAAGTFQRALLAAWWVAPALFFTLIPKKDPTYDLPGLPALAIVIGWGLVHAIDRMSGPGPSRPTVTRPLGWLRRTRSLAVQLLPALLLFFVLLNTLLGSWTGLSDLMATDLVYSVFPAAQWMHEPIGGREEIGFILEVLARMRREYPPPDEIRVAETADYWHTMPPTSESSPQAAMFWQAYSYRATLPYVAEVHRPRVKIVSTLWPQVDDWNYFFENFHKLHYLLFSTRGDTAWPDHRSLNRIVERFAPSLPQGVAERAPMLVDNIVRAQDQFEQIAHRYIPRYNYHLLVYKRVKWPGRPSRPPPPPPAQP